MLRMRVSYNRGFTLIEMMIAVFIIMISMLAFLNVTIMSIRTSLQNDMREMATRLANQTGEVLLALPFSDPLLTVGTTIRTTGNAAQNAAGIPDTVQTMRGTRQIYNIRWNVTPLTSTSIQIVTTVTYTFRDAGLTRSLVLFKTPTI